MGSIFGRKNILFLNVFQRHITWKIPATKIIMIQQTTGKQLTMLRVKQSKITEIDVILHFARENIFVEQSLISMFFKQKIL